MVDRCAREGQAQGDIGALVEAPQLHGNVPLIVVHRHDQVEFATAGPPEECVGRPGAARIDAPSTCFGNGWSDLARLLVAEEAPLAGVGVEARYSDPRTLEAEVAGARVCQLDCSHDACAGDRVDGAPERSMRG